MRIVVELTMPKVGTHVVFLHPEVAQTMSIPSAYLISAGQKIDLEVSARVYEDEPSLPGGWVDARGVAPILSMGPGGWIAYNLPTTRSAGEIARDAVQHGVDYPTHGVDCACMDGLIRELRAQMTSCIPAWIPEEGSDLWERRFDAASRVKYLLQAAGRNL